MSGRLGMTGDTVARGDREFGKAQGNKAFMVWEGAQGTRARTRRKSALGSFVRRTKPELGAAIDDPILFAPGRWGREARLAYGMKKMGVGRAGVSPRGASAPAASVQRRGRVIKVDTTMSEHEAARLARQYDTRGPLPKTLSREQKMKAYEARYIATGGKKGEKWKRRADRAEVGRNIGLAGATAAGALALAHRAPGVRRIPMKRLEHTALASGVFGGANELYGEHARARRASYANTPAGVAGSALSRMQAYTPGRKS